MQIMMEKSKNWMKRYNIGHDAKSPVIGAFFMREKSTGIAVIKIHCYICAFMDIKVPPNDKDKMIYMKYLFQEGGQFYKKNKGSEMNCGVNIAAVASYDFLIQSIKHPLCQSLTLSG